MDSNEHPALPCGHEKGHYVYFVAKSLPLPSLVLERPVRLWSLRELGVVLMHRFCPVETWRISIRA